MVKSGWRFRTTRGWGRSSQCSRHAFLCFCSRCLACLRPADSWENFSRFRRRLFRGFCGRGVFRACNMARVRESVLAAINRVVGAYYYLRISVAMYFWEPSKEYAPTKVAPALTAALFVAAAGTLYLGVFPARVLLLAKSAADSLSIR